ncbi:Stp1/IreP family PP2C-type Ser/Thr phosphatase [Halanaerobium sp. Z-7514]|uniref:Stp1/IreP family PP2C-type Ser/Thr phosphatase n=1 Tax=Halanaerobium polyolivorans TaxID=2886943 RepID=A0AAW4WUJ9_9FIRM|nr:Stp1/IreP family PP2C-type Ser/Thr phosphatase [Halanaerobium polyolivorans]MCC3144777.1 Stp1/IreP family PP2C-type Ser/Thr phosphatase [Halanaerobium polyolivorans]RQD69165.1 MAG: Stp1/IreP family PP2C-type Ser/Thr phosphatase [Halanaerobium sp. MSAO_Bac5]
MRFKAVSDIGKIRAANEDNYYHDQSIPFFMVADGMGGHAAGEVASKIAVEVCSAYELDTNNPIKSLENLTKKINENIIKTSQAEQKHAGMGTTFSAVFIEENTLFYVNLGDSRVYIFRSSEGRLNKISKDHSLVAQMLRDGKITKEEAFNHPQKNIVTQALGLQKELDIDSGKETLNDEDIVLLATDGLTDMLRNGELEKIITAHKNNFEKLADKLLDKALNYGGRDNITFIILSRDNN